MILVVNARTKEEALGYAKDRGISCVFVRNLWGPGKLGEHAQIELACRKEFREKVVQWFSEDNTARGALLWFNLTRAATIKDIITEK